MKRINSLLMIAFVSLIFAIFFAKTSIAEKLKKETVTVSKTEINHLAAIQVLTGQTGVSKNDLETKIDTISVKQTKCAAVCSNRLKRPKKGQIEAIMYDPPPLPKIEWLYMQSIPGTISVPKPAAIRLLG